MAPTRFVLLGGFLGAGKTTLISQIAKRYIAAGKRVAIVTNDQADDLVDTHNLRSAGFEVGEVAGACFCCSFDELVETTESLSESAAPDIILAEPVGSCTDLVATIIRPLQKLYPDRFELAPFGVLLKPSHGKRILCGDGRGRGFSKDAEYIFFKQLEEADYLIIGRGDQLSESEVAELKAKLGELAPGVPVIVASPKTGAGIDDVIGHIESPMEAGRRILEIDYDTYAVGEAEMGWVNLIATIGVSDESTEAVDLMSLVEDLLLGISSALDDDPEASIAHLKTSVQPLAPTRSSATLPPGESSSHAIASIVATGNPIDWSRQPSPSDSVSTPLRCVINARVAVDPEVLQTICEKVLHKVTSSRGFFVEIEQSRQLRPGRPTPTHRYAEV
ncbi:MAG: GTP-binding protein [Planctomycetota bacterium]